MTLQCDNVRQLMIKTDLKHRKYQNNIEATNGPVPVQEYRSCLICESEKQRAIEQHWVFFQWMWEYMYSYCYFRYHQNMNFQQVLPKAFAKSLKTKEMVTRVCLCSISSKACSKKAKLPLTDYKKHWKYEMSQETQWASRILYFVEGNTLHFALLLWTGESMYWRWPTIKICAGHNLWLLNQHQLRYAMKTNFTTIFKTSQSAKSACSQ